MPLTTLELKTILTTPSKVWVFGPVGWTSWSQFKDLQVSHRSSICRLTWALKINTDVAWSDLQLFIKTSAEITNVCTAAAFFQCIFEMGAFCSTAHRHLFSHSSLWIQCQMPLQTKPAYLSLGVSCFGRTSKWKPIYKKSRESLQMQISIIFLWTEKHMAVRDPLPDPIPRVNTVQAQDIYSFFFFFFRF